MRRRLEEAKSKDSVERSEVNARTRKISDMVGEERAGQR